VGSAGWVVVEGSADAIAALARLRHQMLLGGAAGAALIVFLAVLVAARITGPLARLAAAPSASAAASWPPPCPSRRATRSASWPLASTRCGPLCPPGTSGCR